VFSVALSVAAFALPRVCAQVLPGNLPNGARTFLGGKVSRTCRRDRPAAHASSSTTAEHQTIAAET
jgi:hypothetical protein